MKNRLNGLILRGDTTYYTFQRMKTGVEYLKRAMVRGEDIKAYRATYYQDGELVEHNATQFLKLAAKQLAQAKQAKKTADLKVSRDKKKQDMVATLVTRGSKVKLNRQKKPAIKTVVQDE